MDDQIFNEQERESMPMQQEPERGSSWKNFLSQYKLILGIVAGVILIIGIFWFFLMRNANSNQPQSSNVVIQIKGPSQVTSGNEAEYTITYRNGESADLTNVSMELLYPDGFKFKSAEPAPTSTTGGTFNLPGLKEGASATVVIRGKLFGATADDKEIKATLHYHLSNFNSEFVSSQSIHTTILAPNLVLDLNGPVDVVNGQDTTFTATITNVSGQDFPNVAVQVDYPDGFSFTSSSIKPDNNNNYWNIADLPVGGTKSFDITGSFTGVNQEEKLVRADLGQIVNNNFAPQISATASFRVIPSSLVITITPLPKDVVHLGDQVSYKIQYQNQGPIGLSNLIVTAQIEGLFVDYPRISASNAIITNHTLTWKVATLNSLAILSPNESGEIDFSVPTKSVLTANLKNQTIKVSANITSDEMTNPTRAADVELKLASALNLQIGTDYVSGPVPMKVGQTTTFALTFTLSNLSNDLSNTAVVAALTLPSSDWTNVIIPDAEKSRLSFDPSSGIINWKVGDLAAFTGKSSPALLVTFQIAVTPSDSDHGKTINLLRDIQATATDTFTNQDIQTQKISNLTTGDITDPQFTSSGGVVQ